MGGEIEIGLNRLLLPDPPGRVEAWSLRTSSFLRSLDSFMSRGPWHRTVLNLAVTLEGSEDEVSVLAQMRDHTRTSARRSLRELHGPKRDWTQPYEDPPLWDVVVASVVEGRWFEWADELGLDDEDEAAQSVTRMLLRGQFTGTASALRETVRATLR